MTITTTWLIAFLAMLTFDLALLAGTAYLVAFHDWSSWWFLLTVMMCAGSNPNMVLKYGE